MKKFTSVIFILSILLTMMTSCSIRDLRYFRDESWETFDSPYCYNAETAELSDQQTSVITDDDFADYGKPSLIQLSAHTREDATPADIVNLKVNVALYSKCDTTTRLERDAHAGEDVIILYDYDEDGWPAKGWLLIALKDDLYRAYALKSEVFSDSEYTIDTSTDVSVDDAIGTFDEEEQNVGNNESFYEGDNIPINEEPAPYAGWRPATKEDRQGLTVLSEVRTPLISYESEPYVDSEEEFMYNKVFNVERAAKSSCIVLWPGCTYDFFEVCGPCGKEGGYLLGYAFVFGGNGAKEPVYGGGICQTSSTICWAAMLTHGINPIKNHPHLVPVGYIDPKYEATVSYGSTDFWFTNSREYPIVINIWHEGEWLYCQILGTLQYD